MDSDTIDALLYKDQEEKEYIMREHPETFELVHRSLELMDKKDATVDAHLKIDEEFIKSATGCLRPKSKSKLLCWGAVGTNLK